jgi:hypothetical protein
MIKQVLGLLAIVITTYSAHAEVYVEAVEVLVSGDTHISSGNYASYDLTLTKGEVLVVDIQVDGGGGPLDTWLVDHANLQRYEAGQKYSYLEAGSGEVERSSSFRFEVPEANIYYVVLDLTRGIPAARDVHTYAYKIADVETEESIQTKKYYARLYQLFELSFLFDDFDVHVAMCGMENAFSTPDIVICHELKDMLHRENVPEAIDYAFFHKAAHSLLNAWDYPLYDNEDVADELATNLLLVFGQKKTALAAAKWWANGGSNDEALARVWLDDRHTLSPQRARNIISWVNNEDELKRRWWHLVIPKMTDETLKVTAEQNHTGANTQVAIQQELDRRQAIKTE